MSPTPKSRVLANILKQARVDRGLTTRQLAELVGRSQSQISRWETAEKTPTPEQVAQLLGKLDINGADFEQTVALARDVNSSNWVATTLPSQRQQLEAMADFELAATKIIAVSPLLIPGLLQTSDYSREVMEAAQVPSGELATRLAIRIGRKEIITRQHNPVRYVAFIGHPALLKAIGGKAVMAEQCKHLLDMAKRPNIDIHVLRHDAGWNPSDEGLFDIVETEYSAVISLESRRSGLILHKQDDVRAYQGALDMVRQAAMTPQDSIRFIANITKRMECNDANAQVD